MTQRENVLFEVSKQILTVCSNEHITKVAIDGVDGAGKSFFANELTEVLRNQGKTVIHTSVDAFHNPKEVRYRLGSDSARGFFADSYNYDSLKELLLEPLSLGGNLQYRLAAFDYRTDTVVDAAIERAELGSILLIDGIFLHRPEIRAYWNYSIFLEVGFEISVPRGNQRFGGSPDPKAESNRRYVEGQKLYLSECEPKKYASIVINNDDLSSPYIVPASTDEKIHGYK